MFLDRRSPVLWSLTSHDLTKVLHLHAAHASSRPSRQAVCLVRCPRDALVMQKRWPRRMRKSRQRQRGYAIAIVIYITMGPYRVRGRLSPSLPACRSQLFTPSVECSYSSHWAGYVSAVCGPQWGMRSRDEGCRALIAVPSIS